MLNEKGSDFLNRPTSDCNVFEEDETALIQVISDLKVMG
jgi:hypothetical protein